MLQVAAGIIIAYLLIFHFAASLAFCAALALFVLFINAFFWILDKLF